MKIKLLCLFTISNFNNVESTSPKDLYSNVVNKIQNLIEEENLVSLFVICMLSFILFSISIYKKHKKKLLIDLVDQIEIKTNNDNIELYVLNLKGNREESFKVYYKTLNEKQEILDKINETLEIFKKDLNNLSYSEAKKKIDETRKEIISKGINNKTTSYHLVNCEDKSSQYRIISDVIFDQKIQGIINNITLDNNDDLCLTQQFNKITCKRDKCREKEEYQNIKHRDDKIFEAINEKDLIGNRNCIKIIFISKDKKDWKSEDYFVKGQNLQIELNSNNTNKKFVFKNLEDLRKNPIYSSILKKISEKDKDFEKYLEDIESKL
jgi:hypothetical protein